MTIESRRQPSSAALAGDFATGAGNLSNEEAGLAIYLRADCRSAKTTGTWRG
jgi:hypothetical protein